jgi:glycosyltransferase involved in cell wall biosynthesis
MKTPNADIIVPVWNNLFETRACLAAILAHSPNARLIIVDNGSDRQTQLMLEEFSESLGDNGLFISSERNVGLVRAINMGLARSDSDFAVIVRPHVLVSPGWLDGLLEAAREGMASPLFSGSGAPRLPQLVRHCTQMETCSISFSVLALKGEMHMLIGGFDEQLDGGEWCLKDYVSRAWSRGYRTSVTSRSLVACGQEAVLGSEARRQELAVASKSCYLDRWGAGSHYIIYFGHADDATALVETVETILEGARQGHRFTLLLHRRQAAVFRRLGWHALHTAIEIRVLSLFMTQRDLRRTIAALYAVSPDMIPVRGAEGAEYPGLEQTIAFSEAADLIFKRTPPPDNEGIPLCEVP